jgi:ABC-2 type transport system ATP-binding protein
MLRSAKPDSLPAQWQGLVAVDHVTLSIRQGEIFGLVGPSGAGKTTLIRLIATLLQPDSGDIRVFGYDVRRQAAQVQRLINRVSVEGSFFKQLSPLENLLYGMQPYGLDETEALWQAFELLTRLGLAQAEIHTPMEELPRAVLQKVVVARALICRPRLLLLDEPTQGLDPRARYEFWQIVRELRDLHGLTVLLAVQDCQEVEGLCDRIATLERGRVVALDACQSAGSPADKLWPYPLENQPIYAGQMNQALVCEENI